MKIHSFHKVLICLVLVVLPGTILLGQSSGKFHPDQVMVKLIREADRSLPVTVWNIPESRTLLRSLGVNMVEQAFPGHQPPSRADHVDLGLIYKLHLQPDANPEEVVSALNRLAVVDYAERKVIHEAFFVPSDILADTTSGAGLWHLGQISAYEAWEIQQGDSNIVIAVIDAGQTRHVDLYPNIAFNEDDPIDGIDNDNDGYVDNYDGWDFSGSTAGALPDNDPYVGDSHGLWVAGVSSATFDNGLGVAGVGGRSKFLPLKAAPDDSLGLILEGYEAIVYAADQGAQIINCSWGSPVNSRFGQDAVRYATENKQAAVIAAAGNSQSEITFYPAGYKEVLSVASSSFQDTVFSGGFGLLGTTYDQTVDVTAPGFAITSTRNTNQYFKSFTGTSFASPVAAGVVAITLAEMDDLTPFQAAQRVRVTADPIDSLNGPQYQDKIGRGRVNMLRALTDPLKPSIRQIDVTMVNQDGENRLRPGDTITVRMEWINDLHSSSTALTLDAELFLQNTPFITVINSGASPGIIQMNETFSGDLVRFVVSPFTPEDYPVDFRLTYEDDALLYQDVDFLRVRVNPTWLTADINALHTTITSTGTLGFTDYPDNEQGEGIRIDGGVNRLFEAGMLFSSSLNQVSDAIRNTSTRDKDFIYQTSVFIDQSDKRADLVVKGVVSDQGTIAPIGLMVEQEIFGWSRVNRRQFLLIQYIITNTSQADIPGLYTSMFADWDVTNGLINRNGANYDALNQFAYTEDLLGGTNLQYGISVLSDDGFGTYASTSGSSFQFNTGGKASAMRTPLSPSSGVAGYPGGADVYQFVNTGPISLPVGQKDTVVFALVAATSTDRDSIIQEARLAWQCEILDLGPNELFSVSTATPTVGEILLFQDQNPGQLSWSWDFGDGNFANGKNPQHSYSAPGFYLAKLTVTDGTCTQVLTKEIQVLNSTSAADEFIPDLRIFPNPTSGKVYLESPGSGRSMIQLTDMTGRVVYQTSADLLAGEKAALHPQLPAGCYLLMLQQGSSRWNQMLLIQD